MKKSKGFTLAEVLITLVIIGIIAAITVPIVMANHRKQETSARLKKFYSSLSQAVKMAQLDNYSFIKDTDDERRSVFYDNLDIWWNKYLSNFPVTKKVNTNYAMYSSTAGEGEKPKYLYMLNDGSVILAYMWDEGSIDLYYDVNGEKGPNYKGRDLFYFKVEQYDKSDEGVHWIKVCGGSNCFSSSRETNISSCKQYPGSSCSRLLHIDGWEIKDDYPIRI